MNAAAAITTCRKHGLSFVPVKNKRPTLKTWKPLRDRKPTTEEEREWITAEGIAVVTGKLSGIVVLDVDTGGADSLKGKHLPITPTVKTPSGGTHYYYRHPGYNVATRKGILPNVDIRADGGIAVMPASPGYEWAYGLSLDEVPLTDIPEWLAELMRPAPSKTNRRVIRDKGVKVIEASNEYIHSCFNTVTPHQPITLLRSLDRQQLRDWFSNPGAVEVMVRHMGIGAELGASFRCILPGHTDSNASASIARGYNSIYVYRDWHKQGGTEFYLLPEVYASFFTKTAQTLDNGLRAAWGIRLLVDSGLVSPADVWHRPLPADASKTVRKVYDGFIHLLRCRWLYNDEKGKPAPFTWRFGAAWSGVSPNTANKANKELLEKGFIRIVASETMNGRKTALFLPR